MLEHDERLPGLAARIDHTLLSPRAVPGDIERLCREAVRYGFKAVCVQGTHLARAASLLSGQSPLPISVVGFPLGASQTAAKAAEAAELRAAGARELDMVLNLGALASGNNDLVREDVAAVVRAAAGAPVKVILETGLLSDAEKRLACLLCVEAGAAFVKTSTGFGQGGATVRDIRLLRDAVGPDVGVKASGGIRDYETARAMIEAGADRIGSSSSVSIMAQALRSDEEGA